MEEKKRKSTTSARVKQRYNEKSYDSIHLVLRKDGGHGCTKEELQAAATAAGESLNEYILRAVSQRIESQK